MTTTTYRIQQGYHDLDLLLDPECQYSSPWNGDEGLIRHGISACWSVEELAEYFAQVGIPLDDDCRLVEMECELSDDVDVDAHLGAILVIPTRIVSANLITDDFYTLVGDAYDRI